MLALAALSAVLSTGEARAQSCPPGRACFYVPPSLGVPPGYSVGWDMVLASPRGTITGTWRAANDAPVSFAVSPGAPRVVTLSSTVGVAGAYGAVEQRGIFIEASADELIVNRRLIVGPWQSSSTIKSSLFALGTRFRLGSYNLNGTNTADTGFDYVSVYAPFGATVTFTAPAGAVAPFWQGSADLSFSVTLGPGQTYLARTIPANVCTRELMGGLVTASDPIAVESGGRGWSGVCGVAGGCGDDGADNLLPVSGIGTEYVVHDYPTPSNQGEDVAVVADVDGTEVRINGALVATLDAGQVHRAPIAGLTYVETSAPAYVFQNSGLSGCEIDLAIIPAIALAPVIDWVTDLNVVGNGRVAVVITSSAAPTLRLNGAIPNFVSNATVPGRPDLTALAFAVGGGNHSVRAAADFQLGLVTSAPGGTGLFGYFTPFRRPGCGDGFLAPGEGCDDGNLVNGDGCSSTCRIEVGHPGCVQSEDCVPSGRCELGLCVARCNGDADCADGDPCTADLCEVTGVCSNTPVAAGQPGQCAGDLVCTGASGGACVECVADAQCEAPTPLCDLGSHLCVACVEAADCASMDPCTVGACVEGACASELAAPGTPCPGGFCGVDGACDPCPPGGCEDAGVGDAGMVEDAASPDDAGSTPPDAGIGQPDARADAGPELRPDAQVALDAAAPDAASLDGEDEGCGCSSAGAGGTSLPPWLLLAALAFVRPRARRHPRRAA